MLKTRHEAWPERFCTLSLMLAIVIPIAIPATASASTFPPSMPIESPAGQVFFNQANAVARTSLPVFKEKFQLGVGFAPRVDAVNRAQALTECSGCSATAIAFQVVTTTDQDLSLIHAVDVATATNTACAPDCTAVADAYQVVVATDTPWPLGFGSILSPAQLFTLYNIRSEFLALPDSGLTIAQIQSKCADLAQQVTALLADGTASYGAATQPWFSPNGYGSDGATELLPSSRPIVRLYRDIQFFPQTSG